MPTATHIRDLENMRGHAALYRMSPPHTAEQWDDELKDFTEVQHEYVIVSAVDVCLTGPETYIFAADADGNITNWGEMPGSFRGARDHAQALGLAGYTVSRDRVA